MEDEGARKEAVGSHVQITGLERQSAKSGAEKARRTDQRAERVPGLKRKASDQSLFLFFTIFYLRQKHLNL